MPTAEHNGSAAVINSPEELRRLRPEDLPQVCEELRRTLISHLAVNPGHVAYHGHHMPLRLFVAQSRRYRHAQSRRYRIGRVACGKCVVLAISHLAVNPGHFASSMGAVDLTVALHYVFDTPRDRIVWDVGHQDSDPGLWAIDISLSLRMISRLLGVLATLFSRTCRDICRRTRQRRHAPVCGNLQLVSAESL